MGIKEISLIITLSRWTDPQRYQTSGEDRIFGKGDSLVGDARAKRAQIFRPRPQIT